MLAVAVGTHRRILDLLCGGLAMHAVVKFRKNLRVTFTAGLWDMLFVRGRRRIRGGLDRVSAMAVYALGGGEQALAANRLAVDAILVELIRSPGGYSMLLGHAWFAVTLAAGGRDVRAIN